MPARDAEPAAVVRSARTRASFWIGELVVKKANGLSLAATGEAIMPSRMAKAQKRIISPS
jgi:hypothetical protein